MKRPTMLAVALLKQFGRDLGLSVERDVATLRRRCEHEGLSYLTLTLPKLSDALEQGIEHGLLTVPTDFSRTGRLPRFMGGFFSRVFARTGELLPDVDVEALYAIRQICRFFKKLKIGCTAAREKAAIRHYLEVEGELSMLTPTLSRKDDILDSVSRIIWSQVFPEIDPLDIVCNHGPGATADRLSLNERYDIQFWYDRYELTFPSDLHAFPNYGIAADQRGVPSSSTGLDFLSIRDEPGSRVVFVPKTQKAPRVIAIEPHAMQYVQQGLLDYIVPRVEGHRLTRNSIRFSDQTPNQKLAHSSSIDRSLATLDLKDASDRVHFLLVRRIFEGSGILEYLEDARSLHATLPNGQNVILNKFASMGSAICFPVEAMVFYTLIQACMHAQDGICPSSSSIAHFSKSIDIFGDDIIVPVEYADSVTYYLESYGLKVNLDKSFRLSLFRESCGGDYYNGYAVKPVYARQLAPEDRKRWTPETVLAWVSTANQMYQAGLWEVSQVIRSMVEDVIRSRIPRSTTKRGDGVFFESVMYTTNLRFNSQICGYEQKRLVYQPSKKKDSIYGNEIAQLNKWVLSLPDRGRRKSSFGQTRPVALPLDQVRSLEPFTTTIGKSESSHFIDSSGGLSRPVRSLFGDPQRETSVSYVFGVPGDDQYLGPVSDPDFWGVYQLWSGSPVTDRCEPFTRWSPVLNDYEASRLSHLQARDSVLDFSSSVKRGVFKSKHRWVTLIT